MKMKKPSVTIALILIVNVSGITCRASSVIVCEGLNKECINHKDCCSKYCSKSLEWLKFYSTCQEKPRTKSHETGQEGICDFHMQTDKKDIESLNDEYDIINAAHNSLPPNTQIEVSYNGRKIFVTINDRIPKRNGTLLDLSNKAAFLLRIKNEESVLCKIEKLVHSSVLKYILYSLPICFGFLFVYAFY